MSAVLSKKQTTSTPQADICPACGASSAQAGHAWKLVNARGETEWLRCHCCQSYFMDRGYSVESEVSHTQTMTWGDTERGAQLNTFKQRMYKSILGQLQKYVQPEGKSLLDVGCSYGGFMDAAKECWFQCLRLRYRSAGSGLRKDTRHVGRVLRKDPRLSGTDRKHLTSLPCWMPISTGRIRPQN